MEAIWNQMQLERPPNVTCNVRHQKFDTTAFLTTLDKVINDLTSQDLLHKEAAILSRIIYRMKTKFRNDKGVKSMLRVNKALLNYLSLQLKKEYETLKNFVEINNNNVTLPSKQMMEYVLVRTQGFAKLMLRLEEVSRHSSHFLRSRMITGHAWIIAVIAYAVVSRIWLLSRHLIKQCCGWYNNLYQYSKLFNATGVPWLPEGYQLPSDLKSWLSVSWINEPIPSVPSSYGLETSIFRLIVPCEHDFDEDLILDIQDNSKGTNSERAPMFIEKENITSATIPRNENRSIVSNNDTGEVIDRRAFNFTKNVPTVSQEKERKEVARIEKPKEKENHRVISDFRIANNQSTNPKPNVTKKKVTEQSLTFDNVKNKSDIVSLLNKESYPGLDKLQWNMIRKKGEKLLNKLDTCPTDSKQAVLLKKIVKRIKLWIN